ncbi:hypothetical protein ACIBQ6_16810 [Nonomuraea sp. NPDC049655]
MTVSEGLLVLACCQVLQVSESGYYAWRTVPPQPTPSGMTG